MPHKIVTVLGARPQFVKAAVISRLLFEEKYHSFNEVIVHTGQHYDENMSEIFFRQMEIPKPQYRFSVSSPHHGAMTGKMLEQVENVLMEEKPDLVLVYGDTNSTLAGALAAAKLHIPVAHVEAGLRSFNMRMPEEVNRILTDKVSSWLFCPTETAVENLGNEGIIDEKKVFLCGDVMLDAAKFYLNKSKPSNFICSTTDRLGPFALATIHRAENTDNPENLLNIVLALEEIASSFPILLPLHPRTVNAMRKNGLAFKNVKTIEPVSYFDMLYLLNSCNIVFTDSGGLQKEAYVFQKPCVTLREQTEWVELVRHGYNQLTGSDSKKIVSTFEDFRRIRPHFKEQLYGDGNAGGKIMDILRSKLK